MRWQPSRLTRRSSQQCFWGGIVHEYTRRISLTHARCFSNRDGANSSIASILATRPTEEGETITAVGSIRTVRNQKQRSFVEIGDGSTVYSLQALLQPAQAHGLGTGTSVAVKGKWRAAPRGKEQSYELEAEHVEIVGSSDPEKYPLQKKYQSPEYLRTIPHLRLRTPLNALLARLKSECDFYLAEYFRLHDYVRVHPPIITSSDCEGAGEVFQISSNTSEKDQTKEHRPHGHRPHFFRDPKFLTVSSQLHLEAFVHEHPRVWTLSPTFRAEKSDTPRHTSEFWMLEAELRTETLDEVMNVVEKMLTALVTRLRGGTFEEELTAAAPRAEFGDVGQRQRYDQLQERWNGLTRLPYPRITYTDAIHLLQKATVGSEAVVFQHEPLWESGLQLEHEKYIAAVVGQGSPVFVTDYPAAVKPFYMLPSLSPSTGSGNGNGIEDTLMKTAACFDLLLPDGTEVVGGSLREHRLENLDQAMTAHGLVGGTTSSPSSEDRATATHDGDSGGAGGDLQWYLDLRRFGSVPHGGFGLGFDRLVGYLAGLSNIRDVIAWPRYFGRCDG